MPELTRFASRNILGLGRVSEMVAEDAGGSRRLSTSDPQNPDGAGRGGGEVLQTAGPTVGSWSRSSPAGAEGPARPRAWRHGNA